MRKLIVLLAAAALAVTACRREPRLVIVHTNDTHSHFDPVRAGERAGLGGVVERAAFVDSVRNACGADKVLLLHAGDFGQGTSYFTELEGRMEPRIISDLAYDCVALGNHEFDNGIEDLTERLRTVRPETKFVCANVDLSPFELGEYVKPCAVVERGGMKIGVIGLESDLSTNVSRTISSRLQQLDNAEQTNRWADYLHHEQKCDLIILLSHLGYSQDQALIPQTRWIDLVIGGHSHTFVEDFVYVKDARGKKVPIITDGCWGLEMGVVKLW